MFRFVCFFSRIRLTKSYRLNDFKTQEAYYHQIVSRYMKFCAGATGAEDLEKQFSALAIQEGTQQATFKIPVRKDQPCERDVNANNAASTMGMTNDIAASESTPSVDASSLDNTAPELQLIQSAMRKLREAIVSSRRNDHFAQRVYVFMIRATILIKSWESYHPALIYLLRTINRQVPLPEHELNEFAIYQVLDLVCRQFNLGEAFRLHCAYRIDDPRVKKILQSVATMDWVTFWSVRNRVDGYQRCLMSWAEETVRLHALKCIAKTYFTAEKSFIENAAGGKSWEELVQGGLGWEIMDNGQTIRIRKPKAKSAPSIDKKS